MPNLATLSLGGVGGFYPWLIHTGGGVLATGYRLQNGAGVETPLYLHEDGVGLVNAGGFRANLRHSFTAHQTVTLKKDPGEAILTANQSNSTTTTAVVPSFSIPLEVDKRYRLQGWIICQHNNTGRGVQMALTGPAASLSMMHVEMSHLNSNSLATGSRVIHRLDAFAEYYLAVNCPLADSPYLTWIDGLIFTNGVTPASGLGMEYKSSTATHAAQILAGSRLLLTEF